MPELQYLTAHLCLGGLGTFRPLSHCQTDQVHLSVFQEDPIHWALWSGDPILSAKNRPSLFPIRPADQITVEWKRTDDLFTSDSP